MFSTNSLDRVSPATHAALDRGGLLYIDNSWQPAADGRTIPVIDPSSGKEISRIAAGSESDIHQAVAAAKRALNNPAWRDLAPIARERLIWRLAELLEENAQMLAEVETIDVGMPIWMSRNLTIAGAAEILRYMAGWSSKIHGRTVPVAVGIPNSKFFGYTAREPVGVVGAIIPWNVPLMLAVWKLAPALATGCTLVLKPSEEASLSVLLLAELAAEAGIPAGVVNVVTGIGAEAGEALVKHPDIAKITFTGSTVTGIRVAKLAADHVKKVTLELGGKSPQLVFSDADLDRAIPSVANSIFLNSGQICVAGSRLYVQRAIFQEVLDRLAALAKTHVIGPGLDSKTTLGPLINARQRKRVLDFYDGAVADGAESVTGNARVEADGFFIRPTILANTRNSMRIVREEVFGPVLTAQPFDDLEEAIALANDTSYGLASSVWSSNVSTVHEVVPRIKSGKVTVNTESIPYAALPEGGTKASGYGRDLGEEAIEGFLETKAVLIRYA
jgi:phenylacetaldehyde dehydrogenase